MQKRITKPIKNGLNYERIPTFVKSPQETKVDEPNSAWKTEKYIHTHN